MTKEQWAGTIDGREIGDEINADENRALKDDGLVVVFGYSDDNVELRGAIDEEIGAYNGVTLYFDKGGLITNECDEEDCPYYEKRLEAEGVKEIEAVWCPPSGASWGFETDIPHATFNIMEDGELFCVGIVFEMAALA